jgi:hypothetical protein
MFDRADSFKCYVVYKDPQLTGVENPSSVRRCDVLLSLKPIVGNDFVKFPLFQVFEKKKNFFSSSLTHRQNKLECLSLASLSSLV